jgi:hypothetical protein
MENSKVVLAIGIVGLFLYAFSTVDWAQISDVLSKIGVLLIGGAVIWALSQMR